MQLKIRACLMEKKLPKIFDGSAVESIESFVAELVAEIGLSKKIAHWHPLGFVVVPLGTFQNYSYRLHLSSPNFRKPQNPLWRVHDHSYNFDSIVLKGCVHNIIFELRDPSNVNETSERRVYEVQYVGGTSMLNRTDALVVAVEAARFSVFSGNKYSIGAGVFHENSHGTDIFAASLVRTTPLEGHRPRVLGDTEGDSSYVYAREPVSDEDLQRLYGELVF